MSTLSISPCPFCTGEDLGVSTIHDMDWTKAFVCCSTCGTRGPIAVNCSHMTKEELEAEAIGIWNLARTSQE